MQIRIVVLVAVFACDAAGDPPAIPKDPPKTPPITTTPVAPPVAPPPGTLGSFAVYAKTARPGFASKLALTFPAAWKPEVEADFAGMPKQVILELPDEPKPAARPARALAVIKDHAEAFGVLAPNELHYTLDNDMILIGAGARWTGRIVARFEGKKLVLYDHLWPIVIEQLEVPAAAEKLVSGYYGQKGEYRTMCLPGCKKDHDFTVDKHSFRFVAGMALVCTNAKAQVRPAIAIVRNYAEGSRIAGIEKLPRLVDAHTLEPLAGDRANHFYLPGDGTFAGGVMKLGTRVGFDYGDCFER